MAFADAQANAVLLHGETEGQVLLAGTVTKGDAVGFSSGWKRALATTGTAIQMRCIAAEDGVSGQYIVAYFGDCVLGGGRITGATAGGAIYVAEGSNNGQYTQTAPTTTGDVNTIVGYAINATMILLTPQANTHSVA